MIENWKKAVDKDQSFGALLKELSKSFDGLSCDLLISKVYSQHGISLQSLKLLNNHFFKIFLLIVRGKTLNMVFLEDLS